MSKCFSCEQESAEGQTYCGFCGSPLNLRDLISIKVNDALESKIRDRNILETESSIRVFERAWGWVRTVLSIAAVLVAILGVGIFWKASDLWSSVDKAKQAVQSTAESTQKEIRGSSSKSLQSINAAATDATYASEKASAQIQAQAKNAVGVTSNLTRDLNRQADSVRTEVGHAKAELESANQLKPEMVAMQKELSDAIGVVQSQQKTLSSSEEFVKKVFSSHITRFYDLTNFVTPQSIVVPRHDKDKGNSVVFILLPDEPIDETIQVQYRIFVQPRSSFIHVKNVLIFFWGDPVDNLKAFPLEVSYFPDTVDKDIAHSLSFRDGRVYADDQPFPKFGEPDPGYKGNKWLKVTADSSSVTISQ